MDTKKYALSERSGEGLSTHAPLRSAQNPLHRSPKLKPWLTPVTRPVLLKVNFDGILLLAGPNPYTMLMQIIGRNGFNTYQENPVFFPLRTNQLHYTTIQFQTDNEDVRLEQLYAQVEIREVRRDMKRSAWYFDMQSRHLMKILLSDFHDHTHRHSETLFETNKLFSWNSGNLYWLFQNVMKIQI